MIIIKVDTKYGICLLTFTEREKFMNFNYDAYEKVFPEAPATEVADSAVDTFRPTESEKAMNNKPGENVVVAVDPVPATPQTVTPEEIPENGEGENNG